MTLTAGPGSFSQPLVTGSSAIIIIDAGYKRYMHIKIRKPVLFSQDFNEWYSANMAISKLAAQK
ncbi:MAG TPA: hypothetical protein PK514_09410 [Spirochaetota bacterium]|nr:hypothetical protein [Spirochaetota bacterium]